MAENWIVKDNVLVRLCEGKLHKVVKALKDGGLSIRYIAIAVGKTHAEVKEILENK